MNYAVDEIDLEAMCMCMQYKKGILHKIRYETLPFVASLPDFDYDNNTLPTEVELDVYVETIRSISLYFGANSPSAIKLVNDNGTIIQPTSSTTSSVIFRFNPPHTGLNTVKIYTTDNSTMTFGYTASTKTYSVMGIEGGTSKAGTDASLIAVRVSGNVGFTRFSFFNCTQLKSIMVLSSLDTTRNDDNVSGCNNLDVVLDSVGTTWAKTLGITTELDKTPLSSSKAILLGGRTNTYPFPGTQTKLVIANFDKQNQTFNAPDANISEIYIFAPKPYSTNPTLTAYFNAKIRKVFIDCPNVFTFQRVGNNAKVFELISEIDFYVPAALISQYTQAPVLSGAKSINALELG